MKKNKYAASLETVSRRNNSLVNKTKKNLEGDILVSTIGEIDRRKQVLTEICEIFGKYGPIYINQFSVELVDIFNLERKENFDRFKKNIEDGYSAWFIYRFHHKAHTSEGIIWPFEYSIYERDQTYGIQDFKKHFTPKAWKALVKMSPGKQVSLANWYKTERSLSILSKCLHIGIDEFVMFRVQNFPAYPVSLDLEHYEQIFLYLKKYGNDHESLYKATQDVEDHIRMWSELHILKLKYPTIVKDLGIPISGKWSERRFTVEHSRLSQMKRDCDREQILEKERQDKWKKKNFFNIHKFPQLKGTTINVNGIKLHVKLINNSVDLFEEGSKMHHCIFNYLGQMQGGRYFAFSITDPKNPRNCCTVGFSIEEKFRFTLGNNSNGQYRQIVFDQVRGLRNHVMFTFQKGDLVNELDQLMEATGFKEYITDLTKRPLTLLVLGETRIKLQDDPIQRGRAWLTVIPRDRDYVNQFNIGAVYNPRDNSYFLRTGLERVRGGFIRGMNDVLTGLTQSVRSVIGQPSAASDYNKQARNVIQRAVSNQYPRPEVKEKPFLNSDFLKTLSNG